MRTAEPVHALTLYQHPHGTLRLKHDGSRIVDPVLHVAKDGLEHKYHASLAMNSTRGVTEKAVYMGSPYPVNI